MRFSLKWLLAATAYAAAACASVVYAGETWLQVIAVTVFAATCAAWMGALIARGARRAFAVGFAVAAAAYWLGTILESTPLHEFTEAAARWERTLVEQIRTQESAAEAYAAEQESDAPHTFAGLRRSGDGELVAVVYTQSTGPNAYSASGPTEIAIVVPTNVTKSLPSLFDVSRAVRLQFTLLISLAGGLLGLWIGGGDERATPRGATA